MCDVSGVGACETATHYSNQRTTQDKTSDELRAAAAGLLASICRAGGAVLWSAGGYYAEEALKAAVAALEDAATVSSMCAGSRPWQWHRLVGWDTSPSSPPHRVV